MFNYKIKYHRWLTTGYYDQQISDCSETVQFPVERTREQVLDWLTRSCRLMGVKIKLLEFFDCQDNTPPAEVLHPR